MELAPKPLRKFLVRLIHPQTDSKGCKNGYEFGYLASEVKITVMAQSASLANDDQEVTSKKCALCHTPLEIIETKLLVK